MIVSVKQIAGLGPENFSIMPEGVAHAGGLGETPAGAARWVQGGEAGPATHALVLSLRKPESYLGGRLARRLTAAPSAVDRASSRCRPHPQWLIAARLWANLWMTCAYAPRICAQRGDNAVGFQEAKPLAQPATWAEILHTLCTGRNGNVSTAIAASMHKMTESLSEVYLNVIRRENGGD